VGAKTLEPSKDVEIKVCREWSESDLEKFKSIHKQSWGFFVPPRRGDHAILIAFPGGSSVEMAYLNIHNFNIDYGIHVIKPCWRRRIGTVLLAEALRLAGSMGASRVSVVRVFRSIIGTSSDVRAVGFYRANNPLLKASVYRIKIRAPSLGARHRLMQLKDENPHVIEAASPLTWRLAVQ
jgi:GNAT superfamily N-acetyltransferase